jgi:hypothetical protein
LFGFIPPYAADSGANFVSSSTGIPALFKERPMAGEIGAAADLPDLSASLSGGRPVAVSFRAADVRSLR